MAAEQQSAAASSCTYFAFCERLSRAHSADLLYAADDHGRVALEILWLKLSLLIEALGTANTSGFDPDACTVLLDPVARHLPGVWNFRLRYDAPLPNPAATPPSAPDFGQTWLATLLVNPQQDVARIGAVVTGMLSDCGADVDRLMKLISDAPVLGAHQLNPSTDDGAMSAIPADLWRDVLLMGFKLAARIPKFSYTTVLEVADEAVRARCLADCVALQARAQQALFVDPPLMERNVREVLLELIDDAQWLDALSAPQAAAPKTKTVPPPAMSAPRPTAAPVAENVDAEATIIMKRGAPVPTAPTRMPEPAPAEAVNLDSTIIVSRGNSATHESRPTAPPPPDEPENLEATIIVSRDKKRS